MAWKPEVRVANDAKWYDNADSCAECKKDAPEEHVRF